MGTVSRDLQRQGLFKDDRVHLVSITLDPKRDTPAALRRYRKLQRKRLQREGLLPR